MKNEPELLLYLKTFLWGAVLLVVFLIGYGAGQRAIPYFANREAVIALFLTSSLTLIFAYSLTRKSASALLHILKSKRFDLLILLGIGAVFSALSIDIAKHLDSALSKSHPASALFFCGIVATIFTTTIIRTYLIKRPHNIIAPHYLSDNEISDPELDVLGINPKAEKFARSVWNARDQGSLVFGIDAPWGTGKTTFLNFACRFWNSNYPNDVIVHRFEPLRYASDNDLTERLIRDLTREIHKKIFAPEFSFAANRYSKLLKGKADFTVFGIKLSIEPSSETIEDSLDSIDKVLDRIGRKIIVVVDDLDRLDSKLINNVLFTVKRTLKLRNATYVLCFDSEKLTDSREESERTKEFLEKFINIRFNIFLDKLPIIDYLKNHWRKTDLQQNSTPPEKILRLGTLLNIAAEMIEKDGSGYYMRIIGDIRKIKRLVNALMVMEFHDIDVNHADFNPWDIIHLTLLQLKFPGVFREIYNQESGKSTGIFAAKSTDKHWVFENHENYKIFRDKLPDDAKFLLNKLFDMEHAGITSAAYQSREEQLNLLSSRACFNRDNYRNLAKYLDLFNNSIVPPLVETVKFYISALNEIRAGARVREVFKRSEFDLSRGQECHNQFWSFVATSPHTFDTEAADDLIATLIEHLPKYELISRNSFSLRSRVTYTLAILLDAAGWGRELRSRRDNSNENIIEIAHRIRRPTEHHPSPITDLLTQSNRGVLGFYDLMMFRLACSADRNSQLFNLHRALIVEADPNAETSGSTNDMAHIGMRQLSQQAFELFAKRYIRNKTNFLTDIDSLEDREFFGQPGDSALLGLSQEALNRELGATRNTVKIFLSYQFLNPSPPNAEGVGCGFYSVAGDRDDQEINRIMEDYLLNTCFNPSLKNNNAKHFLVYCLSNLTTPFFTDNGKLQATTNGITGKFDQKNLSRYWEINRDKIIQYSIENIDTTVITLNYQASLSEHKDGIFAALDEIALKNSISADDIVDTNGA